MILQVKIIDIQNEFRVFSCWLNSLEKTFDFLSQLSGEGAQLMEANLIDRGHCLPLPTEAFDGSVLSVPIQQLEREWQQQLGLPSLDWSLHYQWCISRLKQRLEGHHAYTGRLKQALESTHANHLRVQESSYSASTRSRLSHRYENLLDQYERLLIQAQVREKNLQQHLHQLLSSVEELA
jgi:hypothetical protein